EPTWCELAESHGFGDVEAGATEEIFLTYLRSRLEADASELAESAETSEYLTQEEVGRRIDELRGERGVSQRRTAGAIGVDPSALSRIESGQRGLAVAELVAISQFFGVPTEAVLRREVEPTPLFRNEGGEDEGAEAVAAFEAIIDDFFAFEAAARA